MNPYLATTYWVLGDRPMGLRIGLPATGLEAITGAGMVGLIAFITPCNPASRPLPTDENARLLREAQEALSARSKRWIPGVGMADDGCWCEPSLLAWPLTETEASELASAWGQNAWVHVGGDWIPRLFSPNR